MTDFLRRLPPPTSAICADAALGSFRFVTTVEDDSLNIRASNESSKIRIPDYPKRDKWVPKAIQDFQDGGAYPEINVAQYPLDMGKYRSMNPKTVALQIGEDGELEYDAITKFNSDKLVVYSKPQNQRALWTNPDDLRKPDDETEAEYLQRAKNAIQQNLEIKANKGQIKREERKPPEFYKYTPNNQAPGHNANCSQRVIRMVEVAEDPIDVAKFKHKRLPRGPPSPPPPVQHSPPRKLTQKDQQDWKVPPCVSNWKNQKGYTIPLDKRLQADGRGLHDVTINDKFAAMSEALYIAERTAREDIRMRNEMMKKKKEMEEQLREQQLRQLAAKARAERSNMLQASKQATESSEEIAARAQREQIEKERKREIERDLRLEKAGKKNKRNRNEDRDISERIALGEAQPDSQEMLYDARLFNQSSGIDSGYGGGNDEGYAIYDKPLFANRGTSGIYKFENQRFRQNVGDLDSLPAFSGADRSRSHTNAPVEFEKDVADPFGLDNLLSEAKKK